MGCGDSIAAIGVAAATAIGIVALVLIRAGLVMLSSNDPYQQLLGLLEGPALIGAGTGLLGVVAGIVVALLRRQ